jgi:F-type H+-transporting ATPase subunit b
MVAETTTAAGTVGVAAQLGLDWRLFAAQLLNFGIVVFVLWRWAYKPLVSLMNERTRTIEQGLKDAELAASSREAADKESAAIVAEARRKAKDVIDEAFTAADRGREESARRAKAEVEKIVGLGREQLKTEKERMIVEVRSEVAGLVAAATEKVVGEKLDPAKDDRLIREALKDIGL